ncbi:hypothetical protein CO172_00195 [Candidatus Uhrbacteria bacterium CG_4_9_14_3_um_filter_36_7]|uniref:Uncharacterized protein n=1 Tax=Candidatus Uhrbacteria bacterium CG_4_9_14_3_um_filter_36_7 TaxID=1975033 RepID=A0A2M7XID4_9BACT|nr:MAG: hypothetical protein CO172_00195 [Candidatus Uhrbacteria bacterium CG_4_9_14_3_um_filter_36_7]
MNFLKILGWILTTLPIISYLGISAWIIKEVINEDNTIKYFVTIMFSLFLVGIILLMIAYLSEFFI